MAVVVKAKQYNSNGRKALVEVHKMQWLNASSLALFVGLVSLPSVAYPHPPGSWQFACMLWLLGDGKQAYLHVSTQ